MKTREKEITEKYLKLIGFTYHKGNAFENCKLPYYVRNSVCLFFNESPPENTYLIGHGLIYNGKYYVATFRWITKQNELIVIYEAITNESIKKLNTNGKK